MPHFTPKTPLRPREETVNFLKMLARQQTVCHRYSTPAGAKDAYAVGKC